NMLKVYAVVFSHDGRTLLTGSRDAKLRLWDVTTGKMLHKLELPDTVLSIALSPRGDRILTGFAGGAQLWSWHMGQQSRPEELGGALPHQTGILSVAFSPDGSLVLTGGMDGLTRLWNAVTRRQVCPPWRRPGVTVAVGFHPDPDRKRFFSAGTNEDHRGDVKFWDIPGPVDGTRDELTHWTRSVTGITLEKGTIVVLDVERWRGPP